MARPLPKGRMRWNIKGFEHIRYLPGVQDEIAGKVNDVLAPLFARDVGNYEGGTEDGGDRVRGYVVTADFAAMQDEASSHPLEAALSALSTGASPSLPKTRIRYTTKAGKQIWATQAQIDNWTRNRK